MICYSLRVCCDISLIFGKAHAKLYALIPPNLGEVVPYRGEATTVASFPAEMFQCFCLSFPALVRRNRWEEGTSEGLSIGHICFELNFYPMDADMPIKYILYYLKVREQGDLAAE